MLKIALIPIASALQSGQNGCMVEMSKPRWPQFHLSTAIISMLIASVVLGAFVWSWPLLHNYMVYGRFFPILIVEQLKDPVQVTGWDDDGLTIADGKHIPIPNIRKLPKTSTILSATIAKGVEKSDGRVFGLVRIWHWCGNDDVREHIVRVDLGLMLEFLSEGETETPSNVDAQYLRSPPHGNFSQRGWNLGEYGQFKLWCEEKNVFEKNASPVADSAITSP